jgi:putative AdoMet-dependent methyltransferase
VGTQEQVELFDAWAANYDRLIETGRAPVSFEGYEQVLAQAVELAQVGEGMRVLDLGTGTGNLAARFLDAGCEVWGMDFSAQMLTKAREKLPRLHVVQADLLADEWPEALNQPFDRVVSSYALHDHDQSRKMQLLARLTEKHLAESGRIVIADIAYPDQTTRAQAKAHWGRLWSEDEHYWAADETIAACQAIGLSCTYRQVSSCAGVFVIRT